MNELVTTVFLNQHLAKPVGQSQTRWGSPICTTPSLGKILVFAMTMTLYPEFWRNQEIPEKFWKRYEQVKSNLFKNF